MRIEKLCVDQFGVLSGTLADGLSDRLNIILANNDSEKQNFLQFVDWMFFGSVDSSRRPSRTVCSGSMDFVHRGTRQRLSRRNDGTRDESVTVDKLDQNKSSCTGISSLIGKLTQTDFISVFSPPLVGDPNPQALLMTARRAGFELVSRRASSTRLRSLERRLDDYRAQLHRLPWINTALDVLAARRRTAAESIERLVEAQRRRRQDLEETYRDFDRQIEQLGRDIDQMREERQRRDDEITRRRRELEEAWRVAEEAKAKFLSRKRDELVELEARYNRGRDVVSGIQLRRQQVDEALHLRETPWRNGTGDSSCSMTSLVEKIDRLRRDALASSKFVDRYEDDQRCPSATKDLTPRLDELRRDVATLCQELQGRRDDARNRLLAEEMEQLRRCDAAISCWLEKVAAQRDLVRGELRESEEFGLTLVDANEVNDETVCEDRSFSRTHGHVRAVLHACHGWDVGHPDADQLLRELIERRDMIGLELERLRRLSDDLVDRRSETELRMTQPDEHELVAARRELEELESRIRSAEQRDRLEREVAALQDEMRYLDAETQPSAIMVYASDMLRRLTRGCFVRMHVDEQQNLHIEDARGRHTNSLEMGQADRRAVYLALCMAMVDAYGNGGLELPLVLDDVLEGVDAARDDAWADAIGRFSTGHQVIFVTRYQHVVDLWPRRDFTLNELQPKPVERPLPPPRPEPTVDPRFVPQPAPVSKPAPENVDHVRFKRRTGVDRDLTHRTEGQPRTSHGDGNGSHPRRDRSANPSPSHERQGLSLTTPLEAAGIVKSELAIHLRDEQIATVSDFLETSPGVLEQKLEGRGIDETSILRCQHELALRCWVVGLSAEEARLLVSNGVSDVDQLAEQGADDLYDRLSGYVASRSDAEHLRGDLDYLREQVKVWVRAARRSRTDWTRFRKRQHGRKARQRGRDTTRTVTVPIETDPKLRFYLDANDPVVDAPTIGPKTAERLHAIGVLTVGDLLSLDPDEAATRLNYRRLNAKAIVEFQTQANLVCRIPELRGHDAQILVACGITEPAELAEFDAHELWARVKPFAKTSEGKRIIRGGKTPDLKEVTSWVRWAQSARTLRAA